MIALQGVVSLQKELGPPFSLENHDEGLSLASTQTLTILHVDFHANYYSDLIQ